MRYPENKDFIFTIFDDTDVATVDYIRPIYDTLASLGMYTTKTVWPLSFNGVSSNAGSHSLENTRYAEYISELSKRGFEIGFHGASWESSDRKKVKKSLSQFYKILGFYPVIYAAHSKNIENLYWGKDRFNNKIFQFLYKILNRNDNFDYKGHVEDTKYYWNDIADHTFKYLRNFTFNQINLLKIGTPLPYKDCYKNENKLWFYTSDAEHVEDFNHLLREKNQDRLIREKGVCIVSTHLAKGFVKKNRLNTRTEQLLTRLSRNNGWFVPVTQVLDFLSNNYKSTNIAKREIIKLEIKWFVDTFTRKIRRRKYEPTEISYLK